MQKPFVLILHPDKAAREDLSALFRSERYRVAAVENSLNMFSLLEKKRVHLILISLALPDENSFELVRALRQKYRSALVLITERECDIDRLFSLEVGADEYVAEPINPRELLLRTHNALVRIYDKSLLYHSRQSDFFQFQGWTLEIKSHTLISPQGATIDLPRAEYRALRKLCECAQQVVSRADLLEYVHKRQMRPKERTVDILIQKLRRHFQSECKADDIISTIHGAGYKLSVDVGRS